MPKEYFKMSATNRRMYNQSWFLHRFTVYSLLVFTLLLATPRTQAAVHSVLTYKNASTLLGQMVTSSTLFWETYDSKDPKQLQYAVEGGKYVSDDEHYPIYVCRVNIDGVSTSGHTEKIMQAHVCVAAHYKHGKHEGFDVLVNKGHLGKVSWRHWRKFNAGIPVGAIRIGEDAYIARRRAPKHQHHSENAEGVMEHRGADYNLGRLDPVGLGKIKVVENDREKDYDEGEVLVETEPFRYELRDIRLNQFSLDKRENFTELASGVLVNRGDKLSVVETVMSYESDHVQYWGSHEGVARGLPTKIFEKDASKPTEINWGLKYSEKRYVTKSVETKLYPGTALNVTLKGNYITIEAPYVAKLFAFYYGSEDSVSRKINSDVRKSYLGEVKLEYGDVYWIENGTLVPTTTTSSTSTTSTTTHATTTSTREPRPMHEPPVVHVKNVGETHSGSDETSLHDSPASNEIPSDVPDNLAEHDKKPALAGVAVGAQDGGSNGAAGSQVVMAWLAPLVTAVLTLRVLRM